MVMRAQITLRGASGLPRDNIVNTFHYTGTGAAARAAVNSAIDAFFDTVDVQLSALVLTTGHTVKHYDLDQAPPRIPVGSVYTFDFNTAPSSSRLPGEVAIVVSTRAAPESGINPASLRNRFYLGPIAQAVVATTGLVVSTSADAIATAAQTMFNSINASGEAEAVVYSPTLDISRPIAVVWVNNEFDTQRRRGATETIRYEKGITPA
jgi:hypothetical protein